MKKEKGFSLIELLICAALILITVVFVANNCNINFRAIKKNVNKLCATVIAGQVTDRYIYSNDFDGLKSTNDISPSTGGDITYEISPGVTVLNNTEYIYNIDVADIPPDLKEITTTVKWWIQPGETYRGASGFGKNKVTLKRIVYRNR